MLDAVLARRGQGVDLMDLYQEGSIAATVAVGEFAGRGGAASGLRAYVARVVDTFLDDVIKREAAQKLADALLVEQVKLLEAAEVVLRRRLEREPTTLELAAALEWTPETVEVVSAVLRQAREHVRRRDRRLPRRRRRRRRRWDRQTSDRLSVRLSADSALRSNAMRGGGVDGSAADQGLGRTVLVIGEDPELAVALRDRLDRAYVTVLRGRAPARRRTGAGRRRRPGWWWATAPAVPEAVVELLRRHPCLVLWRRAATGWPARAHPRLRRASPTWPAAVRARCQRARSAGMRLAPGDGVTMPDGRTPPARRSRRWSPAIRSPSSLAAHCFRDVRRDARRRTAWRCAS